MKPGDLVRLAEDKLLPGDPQEWTMASECPQDGKFSEPGAILVVGHVAVVVGRGVHRGHSYVQLLAPTGTGWIFAEHMEVVS